MKLYQIESKKYQHSRLKLVLLAMVITNLFLAGVQIFDSHYDDRITVYQLMSALSLYKIFIMPLVLATLASMGIQLENQHQMWRILQVTGIKFSQIIANKFIYLLSQLTLALGLEISLTLLLLASQDLLSHFPHQDFLLFEFYSWLISLSLLALHFVLSLKWSNQIISMGIAITGALTGIISIFLSQQLMYILPYSWYGFLIQIIPQKVGNHFIYQIIDLSSYPLLAGLSLSALLFFYMKRMKASE